MFINILLFIINMSFNLTQKQHDAFSFMKSGSNVFLTGPGGTGKSFLLKYFIDYYKNNAETDREQIYVTSTTGLSSLLIDGMTINRYSGIGTGNKELEYYFKKISKIGHLKKRWINTGVLIIDEISMMDPNIFDMLEILARKIRKIDKPFGGIQIILSGDFLQLPPVKCNQFCFESFSWDSVIQKTFYFDEILRQHESSLHNILNDIRLGIVSNEAKLLLDSCLHKEFVNEDGIIPTLLFSKKDMVNSYNKKELDKLLEVGNIFYDYNANYKFGKNIGPSVMDVYKDLINNQYQVEDHIVFAMHNQVMLTVNMPDYGLANGSRGIIIDFCGASFPPNPIVKFLNGQILEIKPHDFVMDENNESVKKTQIPLIHSWAITIHKAQGMSLELVKTDIGSSIFEYGQAYVVLSRIKNIEGLSLINIDYSKIKAHPRILEYYNNLKK